MDESLLTLEKEPEPGGCTAAALPIVFSYASLEGRDKDRQPLDNQDNIAVKDILGGQADMLAAAVIDGHGPHGAAAAKFVAQRICAAVASEMGDKGGKHAVHEACLAVNQDLSISDIDVYVSGCTCCLVLLQGHQLTVANVGDSGAVLGRAQGEGADAEIEAVPLSVAQKAARQDERTRLLKAGARVFPWGVQRVWLQDVDLPGLTLSRSFGDLAAESVGVFAEPEVQEVALSARDKFLIIASDGVWTVLGPDEACKTVQESLRGGDPHEAAEALCDEARKRWNEDEKLMDDITAIVAFLYFEQDEAGQ